MKRIAFILSITALALLMISCGGSAEKQTKETSKVETVDDSKVKVYYFHGRQRCRLCISIQNIAAEAVAENFADNKDVGFFEIDFSDRANAALADKYEIAFSSLVIATDDEHVDLTEFAFTNAISNPEVLKETVVEETNNFLNKL